MKEIYTVGISYIFIKMIWNNTSIDTCLYMHNIIYYIPHEVGTEQARSYRSTKSV